MNVLFMSTGRTCFLCFRSLYDGMWTHISLFWNVSAIQFLIYDAEIVVSLVWYGAFLVLGL